MGLNFKKVIFLLFFYIPGICLAQFAGGNGTASDPYQISTHEHLNNVRNYLDNPDIHFILINDIDLTDECAAGGDYYNYGQGWIPIGDVGGDFRGFFDGNNYAIIGLFIDRPAGLQGLFATLLNAKIINLYLEEIHVKGGNKSGGIAGYIKSSIISNCSVEGIIKFNYSSYKGLISGYTDNSTICYCHTEGIINSSDLFYGGISGYVKDSKIMYSTANVTIGPYLTNYPNDYVGGIAGYTNSSIFYETHSTGIIKSGENIGGITGIANNSTILKSSTDCQVKGSFIAGGFVGDLFKSEIINSYSRGNVIQNHEDLLSENLAGFCGKNQYSQIINSYSTGSVKNVLGESNPDLDVGFLGTFITGTGFVMSGNYFDMATSEQNSSVGASGRTTAEMTFPYATNTFTEYNFENIWVADTNDIINDGYPYLSSESFKTVTEWPMASSINCGDSLDDSNLSGGESMISGIFEFDTLNIVFDIPGIYHIPVIFLPDNNYCFQPEDTLITIQVIGTPPEITEWPESDSIDCGDELGTATLTGGTANVEGVFSFLYPDSVPLSSGVFQATVVFTPNEGNCYDTITNAVPVFVHSSDPVIIDWPVADSIFCGESLEASNLTGGSANIPGNFVFSNADTIPATAGDFTAAVSFLPDNASCYNTLNSTVNVPVNYSTPVISQWPSATAISCGDSLEDSELTDGVSNVPGNFVFDDASYIPPQAGIYEAVVSFIPIDSGCYNPVNDTIDVLVNITSPVISEWPQATDIFCGEPISQAELIGGNANIPGNFILMDSAYIPPNAGTFDSDICFIPNNAACYDSACNSISITVNMSDPVITDWPVADSIFCGESLEASNLTGGSANVPGNFVFSNADTIPAGAGDFTAAVSFLPDNASCYNTLNSTVNVPVNYSTPVIFQWPIADTITYGDSLAMSELNGGNASVNGTFVFTYPSTVPDNSGIYNAEIVFIPFDDNCYDSVNGTVEMYVKKAVAGITISDLIHYYDNTEKSVSVATVPQGLNYTITYDGNTDLPVNIGSYFVEVTIDEQNYQGYATDSMIIHPAELNIKALSFNKHYGDEYIFTGNEYTVSGLIGTDYIDSIHLFSMGAEPDADIGEYPIIPSNASGQGLQNYNINYINGTLTVTNKTILALKDIVAKNKIYDATTNAQILNFGTLYGVGQGDEVMLDTTNYMAFFNNKNVGNEKPVYITDLELTGADANDYVINYQIAFASIFPKELNVINAEAQDKIYDGTLNCTITNAELEGVIDNESVVLDNCNTGQFIQKDVGLDIPVISSMSIVGYDASNYTLLQPDFLKASIYPKEVFIAGSFTADDKTYDETTGAWLKDNYLYPEIIIQGDSVYICDVEVEFVYEGPGNNIPVIINSAELCGQDALNYTLNTDSTPDTTANIFPRQFILTANTTGPGGILVNDSITYSAPLSFDEGTSVIIEAQPDIFYRFDSWSKDLISQQEKEIVVMDSNINVHALFVPNENSPFYLYPNPFSDEIFINKPEVVTTFKIYNSIGQWIKTQNFNGESIKTNQLKPGLYIIKILDNTGKTHVFKMIKGTKINQ
ncbi:MAG: YDG domain-containing protein [Bacteroidota bacterium]